MAPRPKNKGWCGQGFGAPLLTMARTPVSRTAANTVCVTLCASGSVMLPKPTYTGGGPASRNASSSAGGA